MVLQEVERLLHVVHEGVDRRHGEGSANQSRSRSRAVHAIAGAGDVWERVQAVLFGGEWGRKLANC